jgi:hypothetical protein
MVFLEISEEIKHKGFFSVFMIILLSIVMTGIAFSASFLFQNLFLDCLRRCNIYDENGKIIPCKPRYMVLTHIVCIIIISLIITLFYQILKTY